MAIETWLPFGYKLPDDAVCRRARHGDVSWQIVDTDGGGRALLINGDLYERWLRLRLISEGSLTKFSFGPNEFHMMSSGPNSVIEPVHEGRSPNSYAEAMAFANALKATRKVDPDSALQDALYVEDLGKLLPIFSISTPATDDLVLGYWLTGGAQVSVKSARRINKMMSWLTPKGVTDVISAAGMAQLTQSKFQTEEGTDLKETGTAKATNSGDQQSSKLDRDIPFTLPERKILEDFFNEHVIDIVRSKAQYANLGIGFPSAIVLHGPPGCGKTFAIEQLVEYLGWPSFQVDASSVASPFIHDTSKKIAEIFDKAMKNSPSVLIIDEMEAFLADRESGNGSNAHRIEEVAEFLRRIPNATKNEVLVIGMTNRIELIDSAILRRGRFDYVIEVNPATEEEVKALLQKEIAKLPCDKDVDLMVLAKKLSGRPLSDVAFVIREGARLCVRSGSNHISQKFLMEALESTPERTGSATGHRIGFV
ncbi:MAG: ATP-binding protein [Leptothrix sp. (in: b-proteobacteria)]